MAIDIPFLDYSALQAASEKFLAEHSSDRTIPLPIEELVELKLEISVVPVPGLSDSFQLHGYISNDLSTIYVDQSDFERYLPRFRFTLAHELAHLILHRQVFEQLEFDTIDDWMQCANALTPKENSFLEYHANMFAGLILVPDREFSVKWKEAKEMAKAEGLEDKAPQVRDYIVSWLAKQFLVSTAVILKRLEKTKL